MHTITAKDITAYATEIHTISFAIHSVLDHLAAGHAPLMSPHLITLSAACELISDKACAFTHLTQETKHA